MNRRYMPTLCSRCQDRAIDTVVSSETGNIVEMCRCHRLWDRRENRPVQTVVYYTDGSYWRLNAGADKPKKLKGKK